MFISNVKGRKINKCDNNKEAGLWQMYNKYTAIGVCGGTFDPIHFGHLIIAEEIREKFNLDKVIFIPTGLPPHKDISMVIDAEHRYNMVCRAVRTNPYFEASRIEVDRKGYTYTIDTLRELKEYYGLETKIYFIIGADIIPELVTWRDFETVFKMCEFAAALRPGYEKEGFIKGIEELKMKYGARIHAVEIPHIDISSTAIRQRVSLGKTIRYFVPEDVYKYIEENNLYR